MISCGFDAAINDPLGGMSLTASAFYHMTKELTRLNTKLVFTLEGGYCLKSLEACSKAVIEGLIGMDEEEEKKY